MYLVAQDWVRWTRARDRCLNIRRSRSNARTNEYSHDIHMTGGFGRPSGSSHTERRPSTQSEGRVLTHTCIPNHERSWLNKDGLAQLHYTPSLWTGIGLGGSLDPSIIGDRPSRRRSGTASAYSSQLVHSAKGYEEPVKSKPNVDFKIDTTAICISSFYSIPSNKSIELGRQVTAVVVVVLLAVFE